jgi:hypothetical protein
VVYFTQHTVTTSDLLVDGPYRSTDLVCGIYALIGIALVAFDANTLHVQRFARTISSFLRQKFNLCLSEAEMFP